MPDSTDSAGYSGTPLAKKLGIKPGHRVAVLGRPDGFSIPELPEGVTQTGSLRGSAPLDVVLLFVTSRSELDRRFGPASARLAAAGGLWVAWPKLSSGVATDLRDSVVRAHGLDAGLVDNKVCAIDHTWSGLRFVRRLKDR